MPRNPEANEKLRQTRQTQILNAALTIYIRYGYHGTDMEFVSNEAGLAKGLLYYYYKTKQSLFQAMFEWATECGYDRYRRFIEEVGGLSPIEKLVEFTRMIYEDAIRDARLIQFSMRLPFDVHAVFEDKEWPSGGQKSAFLMQTLESIIQNGMAEGEIPYANTALAASSFWAVFVSNLFHFTKMIGNKADIQPGALQYVDIVQYCFRGLGIEDVEWQKIIERQKKRKEENHESL